MQMEQEVEGKLDVSCPFPEVIAMSLFCAVVTFRWPLTCFRVSVPGFRLPSAEV
jgi:hypothetical protein